MKSKFRYSVESVMTMAILAVVWLIYNHYILATVSSGDDEIVNYNNPTLFMVIIAVAIIAGLGLGFVIVTCIHNWFNKRSVSAVISSLAYDLCRLYLDDAFILHCRKFGIEINYDNIFIKSEVMLNCSMHSLAKLVCCVFNKHIDADFDFDKIFYSLADLLIDTWSKEHVAVFVHHIYLENIILGAALEYAVNRQTVNREALAFNYSIENRLVELDQFHDAKSLATITVIDDRFAYASYLLGGGSVVKNWLKHKLTFKRFSKFVLVK